MACADVVDANAKPTWAPTAKWPYPPAGNRGTIGLPDRPAVALPRGHDRAPVRTFASARATVTVLDVQ